MTITTAASMTLTRTIYDLFRSLRGLTLHHRPTARFTTRTMQSTLRGSSDTHLPRSNSCRSKITNNPASTRISRAGTSVHDNAQRQNHFSNVHHNVKLINICQTSTTTLKETTRATLDTRSPYCNEATQPFSADTTLARTLLPYVYSSHLRTWRTQTLANLPRVLLYLNDVAI